jgi:transcriptional regulator with GAF, ATPase, and Fis domain
MTTQSMQLTSEKNSRNEVLDDSHSDPGLTNPKKSFQERVREFERQILVEALEKAGGGVTKAAKDLGLTHQGLCYMLNHRHPDLLKLRTPIRHRRTG